MHENKKRVLYPFSCGKYLTEAILAAVLAGGAVLCGVTAVQNMQKDLPDAVLATACGALLLWLAVLTLANTFTGLCLEKDRLILRRLFGAGSVCPLESVKLFATVQWWEKGRRIRMIAVCPWSQQELTRLQEEKLRKGIFSREDLPFAKRQEDWEHRFARTYLLNKARKRSFLPIGQQIRWIRWDPEAEVLLRHHYPQIPWMQGTQTDSPEPETWTDVDPYTFPRGKSGQKQQTRDLIMLAVTLCIPMVLLILFLGGWEAVPVMACFAAPVLGLAYGSFRKERDTVNIHPRQLSINSGKRTIQLPAEQIKTVVRGETYGQWFFESCLAVTDLSLQELADLETERLERTRKGRQRCAAIQTLPDARKHLAMGYCRRELLLWGLNSRRLLVIYGNAQRQQTLGQTYPNAQWLNVNEEQ